jgi:hypothetical protein
MFFDDDEAELLRIADETLPFNEAELLRMVEEERPGHAPRHEEQRAPNAAEIAKARGILLKTQAAISTAQKGQMAPISRGPPPSPT